MESTKQILVEFIDSFNCGDLKSTLHEGISAIFEYRMSGTASDMYSDGVRIPKIETPFDTTDDDDGPNTYLDSEQENFDADEHELVEELDLFNIENVTMHDKNDDLRDKFHNTNTYKSLIPQMKSMVDSHKLMQSHLNSTETAIKILKA